MVRLRGISTFILALTLVGCSNGNVGDSSVTALSATRDGHGHDTSDGTGRISLDVSDFMLPDYVVKLIKEYSDCSTSGSIAHFYDLSWLTSTRIGFSTHVALVRVPDGAGCFDVYTINFGRSTDETVGREFCKVNSVYRNLSRTGLRDRELDWAANAPYGDESGPHCLNLPGGRIGQYINRR